MSGAPRPPRPLTPCLAQLVSERLTKFKDCFTSETFVCIAAWCTCVDDDVTHALANPERHRVRNPQNSTDRRRLLGCVPHRSPRGGILAVAKDDTLALVDSARPAVGMFGFDVMRLVIEARHIT